MIFSADLNFLHEALDKIFVDNPIGGSKEGKDVGDEEPGDFKKRVKWLQGEVKTGTCQGVGQPGKRS